VRLFLRPEIKGRGGPLPFESAEVVKFDGHEYSERDSTRAKRKLKRRGKREIRA